MACARDIRSESRHEHPSDFTSDDWIRDHACIDFKLVSPSDLRGNSHVGTSRNPFFAAIRREVTHKCQVRGF